MAIAKPIVQVQSRPISRPIIRMDASGGGGGGSTFYLLGADGARLIGADGAILTYQ